MNEYWWSSREREANPIQMAMLPCVVQERKKKNREETKNKRRKKRERKKKKRNTHDITRRPVTSHGVTRCHTTSHDVPRHHTMSHDILFRSLLPAPALLSEQRPEQQHKEIDEYERPRQHTALRPGPQVELPTEAEACAVSPVVPTAGASRAHLIRLGHAPGGHAPALRHCAVTESPAIH